MEDLVYKWLPNSVQFDEGLQLPQFKLESLSKRDCSQNYTTGSPVAHPATPSA